MNTTTPAKVLVTPKPWYQSKMLIFNGLTLLAAFLVWIMDSQNAGIFPFQIDAKVIVGALSVINMGLRWITVAPVEGGPGT